MPWRTVSQVPCLRASGVPFDLRKDNPYYYYDTFDFTVPVGSKGDIYDRITIRFEEIFQSISIIRQAMKKIPKGARECERQPCHPATEE